MVSIRSADGADADFIRVLSATVFSQFGDYDTFLPLYLDHPSVYAVIAESGGAPVGFMMLGLVTSRRPLPPEHESPQPSPRVPAEAAGAPDDVPGSGHVAQDGEATEWLDAELLAIAVSPEHESRRIGTRLLEVAVDCAEGWRRTSGVRTLQLNVAATNMRAARLFQRMGFRVLDPHDGNYPCGQQSVRMVRPLVADPAPRIPSV
jgi:ribosomal protein S18 acetylase RimI-like enzyme